MTYRMLGTLWKRQFQDSGSKIIILVTFTKYKIGHQHLQLVINIFDCNIRHPYLRNRSKPNPEQQIQLKSHLNLVAISFLLLQTISNNPKRKAKSKCNYFARVLFERLMNLFFQMADDRNQLALTAILYNSDLRQFIENLFLPEDRKLC